MGAIVEFAGDRSQSHLAFALLADATDPDFARDHHEVFHRDVVAHLPREGWKYSRERIRS